MQNIGKSALLSIGNKVTPHRGVIKRDSNYDGSYSLSELFELSSSSESSSNFLSISF
jgi:hypothetical protein